LSDYLINKEEEINKEEGKKPRFYRGFFIYKKLAPLIRGAIPFIKANCRNIEE